MRLAIVWATKKPPKNSNLIAFPLLGNTEWMFYLFYGFSAEISFCSQHRSIVGSVSLAATRLSICEIN